jgi:hypothetical protein
LPNQIRTQQDLRNRQEIEKCFHALRA